MTTAWHRFRDVARLIGTGRALRVAPLWLVRQEFHVGVSTWDREAPPPPPALPGFSSSPLSESDIPQLVALEPRLTEKLVRRRLAEGEECRLGWIDGRLVHARWEASRDVEVEPLGLVLRLAPGDIYTHGSYTAPEFRNRGIHRAMTLAFLATARQRGWRRSLALWAIWNTPSARVSRDHAGRAVVGTIGRRRGVLGMRPYASGAVRLLPPDGFTVDPTPGAR